MRIPCMTELPSTAVAAQIEGLRRYARALTRDEAGADDLVQDTLVLAFERADTFRRGGSLRTWLGSILHNQFVSGRRRQAAEDRRDTAFEGQSSLSLSDGADQEHAARLALLAEAFDELPEQQRAALHLVAVQGFSYQEAADALLVPVGTIMSRVSRARAALRTGRRDASRGNLRDVGGSDE